MKRRQGDAKARIVLEGLQGKPVAERCHEQQVNQSPYDRWRDPCLAKASKAFEVQQDAQQDARAAQENSR